MTARHLFLHFVTLYLGLFPQPPLITQDILVNARELARLKELDFSVSQDAEEAAYAYVMWRLGYGSRPQWMP